MWHTVQPLTDLTDTTTKVKGHHVCFPVFTTLGTYDSVPRRISKM